mmetsp:Transcript_22059/g.61500  ORF Transcript_22059/g.61500 Transcript_22059/m.61500 type:complete len:105 (+) Transcript_22059:237-551(+)
MMMHMRRPWRANQSEATSNDAMSPGSLAPLELCVCARLQKGKQLVHADGFPQPLPVIVENSFAVHREFDHMRLLWVGTIWSNPRLGCTCVHGGEALGSLRRRAS